jgi:hypothetical protein
MVFPQRTRVFSRQSCLLAPSHSRILTYTDVYNSKGVRTPVADSARTCLKDISTTHQLCVNKNCSPVTVTHGLVKAKGELSG